MRQREEQLGPVIPGRLVASQKHIPTSFSSLLLRAAHWWEQPMCHRLYYTALHAGSRSGQTTLSSGGSYNSMPLKFNPPALMSQRKYSKQSNCALSWSRPTVDATAPRKDDSAGGDGPFDVQNAWKLDFKYRNTWPVCLLHIAEAVNADRPPLVLTQSCERAASLLPGVSVLWNVL